MTAPEGHLAELPARIAVGCREPLPGDVRDEAVAALLDCLAASAYSRACGEPPPYPDLPCHRTPGPSQWWTAGPDLLGDAFENAYLAHVTDFDPVHYLAFGHPAVVAFPALLALFGKGRLEARQVLGAYVATVEAMSALGALLGPTLRAQGYHVTAVLGAPAAAGACAAALTGDRDTVERAMAAAAASTLGTTDQFGTDLKAFQVAGAARTALHSALFVATWRRLATPRAWYQPLLRLAGGLPDGAEPRPYGAPLALSELSHGYKRAPFCAYFDPVLWEFEATRGKRPLEWASLDSIEAEIPDYMLQASRFDRPVNVSQARFSLPYLLALLARFGEARPDHYRTEAIREPGTAALAELVRVIPSPCGGRITFRDGSGTTVLEISDDPDPPANPDPVRLTTEKFRGCCTGVLTSARAHEVAQRISSFEDLTVDTWLTLLSTEAR